MIERFDFLCSEIHLLEGLQGEYLCVKSLHLRQETLHLTPCSVNRLLLIKVWDFGK